VTCTVCGFVNSAAARFCAGCGKALDERASAPDAGERRQQITVLFCDLVGSTELAQSLDPEDLRDLFSDYQRVCADAVSHHDGHIAQYLGDGVVAYFGFPRTHEDDARRAVRCGLDILSEMRAHEVGPAAPTGVRPQVRVGVHTGRVVVGTVGPQREYLAQGDTPNIAARVQSEAAPGTLAVSDATWRIVHGYFRGQSLGDRRLKGVAQPVRLWWVTGASGAESRLDVGGELTRYVGRRRELRELETLWASAEAEGSRFVTLRGDPGIGKSRLVQEFMQHAGTEADVLVAHCTPYSQNSAFLPIVELVGNRLDLESADTVDARLERIDARLVELGITSPDAAPLLAELLSIPTGDRYPPLEISAIRRRSRTLEVLVAAVEGLASRRPTILVAEDVHWADPSTLELLQLLVSAAPRLPLLGLFTARPEFEPPWRGEQAASLLELEHLDDEDVEAIARSVAEGKAIPADVIREITRRCDGVPLFVEEMTRTVIESGVLEKGEFSWNLTGVLPKDLIPASVDALLMARVERLGEARPTAQLAATIGREFSYPLLQAVSERSAEMLDRDLQQLVDAGLAWQATDGDPERFVFKHALVQVAAYESLLRSERKRFHERIARVLERRFPEVAAERPELIAYHLTGAGENGEAVGYWEAAGRRALARTAMQEAAAHFRQAIATLGNLPEDPRRLEHELDLQGEIAPVLMTVNGWGSPSVRHACERARDLAIQLGRYDRIYPAAWGLWTYYFLRGEMDNAAIAAKSALEMAEASGDPMIRVTGRHATAYTHLYRAEFESALAESDTGLALFDLEQERVLAATFQLSSSVALRTVRATSLWMLGQFAEAEREKERMVQLGRELGHMPSLAAALAFQLHLGLCGGWHAREAEEQIRVADELRALCKDEGLDLWYAVALVYRGAAAAMEGDAALANELMDEGFESFVQTGARLTLVPMNVMCAEARILLGEDDEARRLLAEAQVEADARNERLWEPEIDRVRAGLLVSGGDAAAAEESLRRALEKARAQKASSLGLRAALDLHELLSQGERCEEGRALVEDAIHTFETGSDQPEVARARSLVSAGLRPGHPD
jgi:class 3 adenylate cyclase/tetratricopeptide (TPR) repeat protein